MRRSFGGGSSGMGGGSGGGGGMLRSVHRAVRAGVGGGAAAQEPFSHHSTTTTSTNSSNAQRPRQTYSGNNKKSSNTLTLSSHNSSTSTTTAAAAATASPFSSINTLPLSAAATAPGGWPSSCTSPTYNTDHESSDWECVDGSEDERVYGFYEDSVFGTVPSREEVQHAVTALQQVFDPATCFHVVNERLAHPLDMDVAEQVPGSYSGLMNGVSPTGSDLDWIEPSVHLTNSKLLQPHGSDRVYDAFHLLQTDPSVQRMVISLSSDRAVWDAVLNNEVVRELRESLNEVNDDSVEKSDEVPDDSDAVMDLINWLFVNAKTKAMELVDKITSLAGKLFHNPHPQNENAGKETTEPLQEKLRTSFLLSVFVLLIVVVTRAHRA